MSVAIASVDRVIRRALIALTLLAGLTACGGSVDEPGANTPPPSAVSSTPPAPTTSPAPITPPAPTTPAFPKAKDGQNYKACNDGNCEVLIHKKAVITISGEKNTATVKDGGVSLVSKNGSISLGGVGGVVSWGNGNGPPHTATLKAAEGDTVIMVIITRR